MTCITGLTKESKINWLSKTKTLGVLPFNRDISPNKALRESLREFGWLNPIKVVQTSLFGVKNGLYKAGGQHTYTEAKFLELDIPYVIIYSGEDLSRLVEIVAIYNSTQRKWGLGNYVNCYCSLGNSAYIYLRQKQMETCFSFNALYEIYTGRITGSRSDSTLKKGKFLINDVSKGDALLSYILDINKIVSFDNVRYIRGFISFFNSIKTYNHSKFLVNFKANLPILSDCLLYTDFAKRFMEIYSK